MIKLKLIILFLILIIVSSCSEIALLASGSSLAISQNTYVRSYSGIDVLTLLQTQKDIKTHIYEQTIGKDPRFTFKLD